MRVILSTLLLLVFAVSSHAFAGQTEAKECAASLDEKSQLVFNAVLPKVVPGAKLKDEVVVAVKALVKSGQISRADAKKSATAAAKCLKLSMK
jgi:hypothetical protein